MLNIPVPQGAAKFEAVKVGSPKKLRFYIVNLEKSNRSKFGDL